MNRLTTPVFLAPLLTLIMARAPTATPSFDRVDGSGKLALADLDGKVTVVQFWASWCKSCAGEAAKTAAFAQSQGVDFLGVSEDEDMPAARSLLKKVDDATRPTIARSVLDTDMFLAKRLNVEGVPATAIVGPDGKPRLSFKGHATDDDRKRMKSTFESLRSAKGTTP